MSAKLIQGGDFVTRGERKAAEYLRDHLPEGTIILTNLEISSGEFACEMDMVVIGDRCVWVIDEKGLHGTITGDAHTWVLADGLARERVIANVRQAARVLKGRLADDAGLLRLRPSR